MISGLCRGRAMRNFRVGDCFIYITRIDPRMVQRFASGTVAGPHNFAVAALRVVHVWPSHQIAATDLRPGGMCPCRYVRHTRRTSRSRTIPRLSRMRLLDRARC